MKAIECIKTRRSIRKYQDKEIPDKVIKELIDCARRAPSAHNCQSWEFVIVKDKEAKEKLSRVHRWAGFAKNAPAIIAVCYDKEKYKKQPTDLLNPAAATENLLLAAHALGLGACWVNTKSHGKPGIEQEVKQTLNIPENIGVLCIVPIGYPGEEPRPKKIREIDEMTHLEKW